MPRQPTFLGVLFDGYFSTKFEPAFPRLLEPPAQKELFLESLLANPSSVPCSFLPIFF